MTINLASQVLEKYPDFRLDIIKAHCINNTGQNKNVIELLHQQKAKLREVFDHKSIAYHPHMASFRENQNFLSGLIDSALNNKPIANETTLELLCKLISLRYLIPVTCHDTKDLTENIEIELKDNETIVYSAIKSEKKISFFDLTQNSVKFANSKVNSKTKNALTTLVSLAKVEPVVLNRAAYELASLIDQYCGGQISVGFADQHSTKIVLQDKFDASKLKDSLVKSEEALHSELLDVYSYSPVSVEGSLEHQVRLEKVDKLNKLGINPWPPVKEVNASSMEIIEAFEQNRITQVFKLSGRVMSVRLHGKAAFATIQDISGQVQIYIKKDIVGEKPFEFFKEFIDIGDILWVSGTVFKTKMGEITLEVKELELQSKCLYPLPEKFHGLTDIETKYRQRYLDLMVNAESKNRFIKRSLLISTMRDFLNKRDYLEVETPMLHPIAGGAAARPFITYHNALDSDFYLRIAPELYLKRLVIGGLERVYEINRNFRNEGVSTRHNPEFTMIEFYTAYRDYNYAMDLVEELLKTLACALNNGETCLYYGEHLLQFGKPFERISMLESVVKYGNIDKSDLSHDKIDKSLEIHKIRLEPGKTDFGYKLLALFEELVEKKLIQPTFITGFPIEISPLAKRDPENPNIASRFELFISGMEISNGFNELNDPFDQAERFNDQLKNRESGDVEAHEFDADYIRSMEYGLPPTVGVGIGIDRLAMLLTNTQTIREVILFPTLKKK